MLITRFDPFKDFQNMQKVFNYYPAQMNEESSISTFSPLVNTRESKNAYHIDVDLPGVKKKDIDIDIDKDKLIIKGERSYKEELKEKDYYKIETRFGKFHRVFHLPENIDTKNISAKCDSGVLEINLPKLIQTKEIQKIEIK